MPLVLLNLVNHLLSGLRLQVLPLVKVLFELLNAVLLVVNLLLHVLPLQLGNELNVRLVIPLRHHVNPLLHLFVQRSLPRALVANLNRVLPEQLLNRVGPR